ALRHVWVVAEVAGWRQEVLSSPIGANTLTAQQHIDAGAGPLHKPALVEPRMAMGNVGGGAKAERPDGFQRDAAHADRLCDPDHDGVVRPYAAVHEADAA